MQVALASILRGAMIHLRVELVLAVSMKKLYRSGSSVMVNEEHRKDRESCNFALQIPFSFNLYIHTARADLILDMLDMLFPLHSVVVLSIELDHQKRSLTMAISQLCVHTIDTSDE